ncbi:hypothetical protein DL96DRAFT_1810902 [Flagelloscypha sp. PMI_526]|nr:hypothetical protein DL96DRAFT_1810902 [Flagelloscypha sp. PMI_526]
MFSLPILAFAALSLVSVSGSANKRDSNASVAQITSYGVNGSGCAPGTVSTSLSDGGGSLQASFKSFEPTTASTSGFRKNCQATITVTVPAGKQFTVPAATYDGYVRASSGTTVTHSSLYYFQGSVDQRSSSDTIDGPVAKDINLTNTFNTNSGIWSACGGSSIVNVDISVIVDGTSGYADVDQAKIGPFTVRDC